VIDLSRLPQEGLRLDGRLDHLPLEGRADGEGLRELNFAVMAMPSDGDVFLEVTMSPLCREDCQGLCPACGKNWNKGKCQCRPEFQRSPSALAKALSGLKLDLEP
jgi:hypothetical protein